MDRFEDLAGWPGFGGDIGQCLALNPAPFRAVAILHDIVLEIIHLLPGNAVRVGATRGLRHPMGQEKEDQAGQDAGESQHTKSISPQPWIAQRFRVLNAGVCFTGEGRYRTCRKDIVRPVRVHLR